MKFLKWILILLIPFIAFDMYHHIKGRLSQNNRGDERYVYTKNYWHYQPNDRFTFTNEDHEEVEIQSDQYGFRNSSTEKKYDVLLLGDSFIDAVNTPENKTYASHLNRAGFKTYNAAMGGTGTCHQAFILGDLLGKVRPRLILLNFYLGNDFHDNFFCHSNFNEAVHLASNLPPTTATPSYSFKESLKNLITLLSTYSPSMKMIYEYAYTLLRLRTNDMGYYDRAEIKTMTFNLNKPDQDVLESIQKTELAIKKILNLIQAYNAQNHTNVSLIVVGIPSKAQVLQSLREVANFDTDRGAIPFSLRHLKSINFDQPNHLLAQICSKLKIPYISLLKPFRSRANQKLYYYFDPHWTWLGQKLAADTVIPFLKRKR